MHEVIASSKIIIPHIIKTENVQQSENREWTSLVRCIFTHDQHLSLMIIFKGKRLIKEWFKENIIKNTVLAVSEKSWTDNELELEWLTKIFKPYNISQTVEKQLLLLNSHESHYTSQFIDFHYKKGIISLCLPPYSTHLLQPLEISLFEPLVKAYKKSVENNSCSEDCYSIDKQNFLKHYL